MKTNDYTTLALYDPIMPILTLTIGLGDDMVATKVIVSAAATCQRTAGTGTMFAFDPIDVLGITCAWRVRTPAFARTLA